ncbi:TPA: hypothetical protein ACOA6Q_002273 [Enterococcus faecium]|uniref:hypothetical protein n=1 Tax=Enterococcus faecium TaxID=1352 RepID=UPI0010C177A2|nr:hypothetical protein [Enterococcus faecium]EME7110447.1 hypothetical protein [Enterococcus faecium]MCH3625918.1 hypothetical protein [Enterococcus faecium]MCU1904472.1 hypothetical protein [Enterococcus faecium]MCU1912240.1 hypothetical protein [Enterococcus faecium]MCU1915487.1 hypothetical protein [Enterococcus faecium]
MKKVSVMLLLSTALLLSACSNNKKAESTDATSNQETNISKTKETTEISSSTSKSTSKTDSSSTVTSSNQATAKPSPTVISSSQDTIQTAPQEETYEQMKQRTLQSTPADRANWSNKEWEAFGVALYENGLTTDDAGNIISQDQKEQQAASQQNTEAQQTSAQQDADTLSLTDFVNKYGMSPVAWKVQNGMSEEEALRTTQQKTSGEVQLGFSKYGIQ